VGPKVDVRLVLGKKTLIYTDTQAFDSPPPSRVLDPDPLGSALKCPPWIRIRIRDAASRSGSSCNQINKKIENNYIIFLIVCEFFHKTFADLKDLNFVPFSYWPSTSRDTKKEKRSIFSAWRERTGSQLKHIVFNRSNSDSSQDHLFLALNIGILKCCQTQPKC